ncbi:hypothetical protein MTO98_15600 [Mucilaginibacter sp. SMC90]|uniref:hypothetical protein n=1 Tax=Mucilaginibacter sp. SMC90 TaxID=2929803 RepID=UPI001FB5637C|nr:hypothetical protein [Mucilaginibacter sp. SMC90]UOE52500.1 hypothetical protein MTO98_15600 [Mucilaginibacter sp. SMC90]
MTQNRSVNVIVAIEAQQNINDAITELSENGGKVTGLKIYQHPAVTQTTEDSNAGAEANI